MRRWRQQVEAEALILPTASCAPAVTRVRSQGSVDVLFNVALKDLHRFGYRNGAEGNHTAGL